MLLAFYHFKLLSFVLRVGLEPTRPCGQGILSPSCLPFHHQSAFSAGLTGDLGAENETRTRDPDLGKVVLYQLSYFRLSAVLSGKRDSNSRPRPWQGRALPTELFPHRLRSLFQATLLP